MDVELRYVADCPNVGTVSERLAEALATTGHRDVVVRLRLIENDSEAVLFGFTGSPTIIVDGRDPFLATESPAGLSCRLYRTTVGLAGSPTLDQLIAALTPAQP